MKIMKPVLGAMICASLLIPAHSASAATPTYNANNQVISFVKNIPGNEILAGGTASSAAVRYSNVITIGGTQIDALVSIVSLVNMESDTGLADNKVERIDDNDDDAALEVKFNNSAPNGIDGYAMFDVEFVARGTSNPVKLQNVTVYVDDVDNDQYVEFFGLANYVLSEGRVAGTVAPYTGSSTFTLDDASTVNETVPSGAVRFFSSGSSSDHNTEHLVVEARFSELTKLRTKVGSFRNDGATIDLNFRTFAFTDAADPVAVVQPSFDISYDANDGVGTAPSTTSASGAQSVAANGGPSPLTREGFTFRGWNTRADGTGVTYTAGSSIIPIADTTLYALWRADSELANTGLESDALLVGATAVGAGALLMAIRTSRRSPRHRA